MIRRAYSPPYQSRSPRPGPDDIGAAVKGLVSVEIQRSSEMGFALETYGCDGKPILSLLRDLPCEADGKLTIAGRKNGMPFRLGAELPRGLGSAIRGAGGGLVTLDDGAAFRGVEWVVYDNFGNHWSLDQMAGSTPLYLGETPIELNAQTATPALCTMAPRIRPYQKTWEFLDPAAEGGSGSIVGYPAAAGWQEDNGAPVVVAAATHSPYSAPSPFYRIEQWAPDDRSPRPPGTLPGVWPDTTRRVTCEWLPSATDSPRDYDAHVENGVAEVVSKYPLAPAWSVDLNRWTRPLIEHVSTGGIAAESGFVICVERNALTGSPRRIALRGRSTAALHGTSTLNMPANERVFFTPHRGEGWLMQSGEIVSGNRVRLHWMRSRETDSDYYGSGLYYDSVIIPRTSSATIHAWADPVWMRVGRVIRTLGGPTVLVPYLPRWR